MEQKDFEKIIEDYDFACQVVKRYGNNHILSSLYELFDELGYRCYNFDECDELFDMEIGNLTLTYYKGKIDKSIQIWYDEEWHDTDIKDFKNNLGLAMLSHTIYKNNFYEDHDYNDVPVCLDEFLQNEWKDDEVKDCYIKQIKVHKGE